MDDIAEQQQIAGEITNAISNPIGFDQNVDEVNLLSSKKSIFKFNYFFCKIQDDLLKELEELQDQDLEDELLKIPDAPSHNLPANKGKF